ncbi:secretin and TonB N-terminal domain-containing protein [Dyella choica]|uniref:Secretin/TonB short N-terminal domain-containing protein n=1 Tax=Dyella choica TaxID=1927959 RepID=A0A432M676_9GAMM|nr:secretin and TonB N-terminal domain-containing protein [Dyella choica]RUL75244.1 hypothetical protein EKH80_10940 [Dyella choica]
MLDSRQQVRTCAELAALRKCRKHFLDIVLELVQGGHTTCVAFVSKGLEYFVVRRFADVVLCLTLCLASPAEAVSTLYQANIQTNSLGEPRTGAPQADDIIAFDMPPQSLLTALRTYSELTGQAVLVDNALAAGRHSPGIHGSYGKTEALQKLLAGTGLVASFSSDQAFTLKLSEVDVAVDGTARKGAQSLGMEENQAVIEHYAGKIQRPIEVALCQSEETRPGTYRLALQIWIAASGRIEKARLLSPVGSQRDDEVRKALNALELEPPPSGMPQPITLLLLPGRADRAWACAPALPYVH